tara:strand:+ start:188 stop:445 length:258 start_codon:yes stop_codon:yes gene_type:complete
MKVNKIGENLTKSYSEWKEYVSDSVQQSTLKREIPKTINKLKDTLGKFDDKFLGKYNYFLDVKYLRKKTEEMYNRSKNFINNYGN